MNKENLKYGVIAIVILALIAGKSFFANQFYAMTSSTANATVVSSMPKMQKSKRGTVTYFQEVTVSFKDETGADMTRTADNLETSHLLKEGENVTIFYDKTKQWFTIKE